MNGSIRPGDSVFLGHYPQGINGDEYIIEWRVLRVEDERVLVSSRYILDSRPFHDEAVPVRWEDCTLRSWLNCEFFDYAFDEEEKKAIHVPEERKDPDGDAQWQSDVFETDTGKIGDRIFLLSKDDPKGYCPKTGVHLAEWIRRMRVGIVPCCTDMAAWKQSHENYWLRMSMKTVPVAFEMQPYEYYINEKCIDADVCSGVRPAMWLSSKICMDYLQTDEVVYEKPRISLDRVQCYYEYAGYEDVEEDPAEDLEGDALDELADEMIGKAELRRIKKK